MKIGIVGSRTFNDYDKLLETMSLFNEAHCLFDTIVSGGAKGADSAGEAWGKYWNIKIEKYLPDWDKHGKAAGFIRNQQIVDNSDMIVAFWDGESRGTADTIEKAKKAKKPTFIVYF